MIRLFSKRRPPFRWSFFWHVIYKSASRSHLFNSGQAGMNKISVPGFLVLVHFISLNINLFWQAFVAKIDDNHLAAVAR